VEDEDGHVSVYMMTGRGTTQLEFDLKRHDDQWLIRKVRISR
jgi:hypothetical protein